MRCEIQFAATGTAADSARLQFARVAGNGGFRGTGRLDDSEIGGGRGFVSRKWPDFSPRQNFLPLKLLLTQNPERSGVIESDASNNKRSLFTLLNHPAHDEIYCGIQSLPTVAYRFYHTFVDSVNAGKFVGHLNSWSDRIGKNSHRGRKTRITPFLGEGGIFVFFHIDQVYISRQNIGSHF